jgi:hypothetical protein
MSRLPQLLSSVNGKITAILLVFPGLACEQGDAEYAEIVSAFEGKGVVYRFRQEAHGVKLKVSQLRDYDAEPRRMREIQDLRPGTDLLSVLEGWEEELRAVEKHGILAFRRWAQDPFLVLKFQDWTILLDSLHNRRLCDFFLPLEVAQQAGPQFLVKPTRLYLEGGNILRGQSCVFVGEDLIVENQQRLGFSALEVLQELRNVLGVEAILPVGYGKDVTRLKVDGGEGVTTRQPLFHLDMFMSLGGIDAASGQEVIFLARPSLCATILSEANVAKVFASEAEAQADGLFSVIADQLTAAEFKVISLPIFFYDNATFSWNNCLVEVSADRKTVYLPSYQSAHDPEKLNPAFRCLEEKVTAVYGSQGFEVVWFRNGRFFRTLARHGGSLHCAVKVMGRTED